MKFRLIDLCSLFPRNMTILCAHKLHLFVKKFEGKDCTWCSFRHGVGFYLGRSLEVRFSDYASN